jgi:hypothetical protein
MCCMIVFYTVLTSCVPASSVRLLFLQEVHGGGLMGHFGVIRAARLIYFIFSLKVGPACGPFSAQPVHPEVIPFLGQHPSRHCPGRRRRQSLSSARE